MMKKLGLCFSVNVISFSAMHMVYLLRETVSLHNTSNFPAFCFLLQQTYVPNLCCKRMPYVSTYPLMDSNFQPCYWNFGVGATSSTPISPAGIYFIHIPYSHQILSEHQYLSWNSMGKLFLGLSGQNGTYNYSLLVGKMGVGEVALTPNVAPSSPHINWPWKIYMRAFLN